MHCFQGCVSYVSVLSHVIQWCLYHPVGVTTALVHFVYALGFYTSSVRKGASQTCGLAEDARLDAAPLPFVCAHVHHDGLLVHIFTTTLCMCTYVCTTRDCLSVSVRGSGHMPALDRCYCAGWQRGYWTPGQDYDGCPALAFRVKGEIQSNLLKHYSFCHRTLGSPAICRMSCNGSRVLVEHLDLCVRGRGTWRAGPPATSCIGCCL